MKYQNEELLRQVPTDNSAIPANVLNFSEAALYVCEGIEVGYNQLFQSIGINELAVFESTGELIAYNEAEGEENKKKFIDTVVEFFKGIWAKIKKFFTDLLEKFKKMIAENKKNITEKINNADFANLPVDNFGTISDYSRFDNAFKSFGEGAKDHILKIKDEFDKLAKGQFSPQDASELKKKLCEEAAGAIVGSKEVTTADQLKKYIKDLVGTGEKAITLNKQNVKSYVNDITSYVFGESVKADTKKLYNDARRYIDETIKAAKDIGKQDKADKIISVSRDMVGAMKETSQMLVTMNGAVASVLNRKMGEYRAVAFRISMAVNKANAAEKKAAKSQPATATGESALFGPQIEMVNKAFAW